MGKGETVGRAVGVAGGIGVGESRAVGEEEGTKVGEGDNLVGRPGVLVVAGVAERVATVASGEGDRTAVPAASTPVATSLGPDTGVVLSEDKDKARAVAWSARDAST